MTQPETKAQLRDRICLEIYLRIHPHMNTPDNKVYHTPERSKTLQALHELWNERDKLAQQEVDGLVKALESIAYHEGNKETPNMDVSRHGAITADNNNIHVAKEALAIARGGV